MKNDSQPTSLDEGAGLITTLLSNLTGPDARMWLEAFKLFLKKKNPWTDRIENLWKSILVGGKSAEKLMKELLEKGFKLGDYAKSMTNHKQFTTSRNSKKVDFAKKSLKEFGFTGKTFGELLDFFRNHPLYELSQPEDVYYLRLAYTDQPKGEWVRLAMETIPGSDGGPGVFGLERDGGDLWLGGGWYGPAREVDRDGLWFVRLRK